MQCVFCGSSDGPISTEHVVPKWARKLLEPLEPMPFRAHAGEAAGADQRRKIAQVPHLSVVVDNTVCQQCNNGFLARLERRASKVLAPMIQTARHTTLDADHQAMLATWATKTVWLLELAARQMFPGDRPIEGYLASEVEFAWLWQNGKPPPRTLLWITSWDCERNVPMMYQPSGASLPTSSGNLHPGHMTTFSLGYVAFQVFSTNFVTADQQGAALWNTRPPASLASGILRIWPSLQQTVEWPGTVLGREEWTRLTQWDGRLRPPA